MPGHRLSRRRRSLSADSAPVVVAVPLHPPSSTATQRTSATASVVSRLRLASSPNAPVPVSAASASATAVISPPAPALELLAPSSSSSLPSATTSMHARARPVQTISQFASAGHTSASAGHTSASAADTKQVTGAQAQAPARQRRCVPLSSVRPSLRPVWDAVLSWLRARATLTPHSSADGKAGAAPAPAGHSFLGGGSDLSHRIFERARRYHSRTAGALPLSGALVWPSGTTPVPSAQMQALCTDVRAFLEQLLHVRWLCAISAPALRWVWRSSLGEWCVRRRAPPLLTVARVLTVARLCLPVCVCVRRYAHAWDSGTSTRMAAIAFPVLLCGRSILAKGEARTQ
jgi:hypothetical protein